MKISRKSLLIKFFSLFAIFTGVFVLLQVLIPYLQYKTWEAQVLAQDSILLNPEASKNSSSLSVLGISIENQNNFPGFFSNLKPAYIPYESFTLDVPQIHLKHIKVLTNSNDFSKFAAHLPGTALPGEKGNVFISGHSSLPLVKGKTEIDPVFWNLPYIRKGMEINLTAGNQTYIYKVLGIKIVDPKEVSVINPPDSTGRYLTLMTCVPPGFNTKRLVVLASLEN